MEVSYHKLEKINSLVDSKLIKLRTQLAKALILKSKPRMGKKMEAQRIFEELTNSGIIDFRLSVFALLNRCDLLLLEYQAIDNPRILEELYTVLNHLLTIALEQQSYNVYIEVLVLQSRLSLLQFHLDKAIALLDDALITTEEQHLTHLHTKVKEEHAIVSEKSKIWRDFLDNNVNHLERMKQTEIVSYLKNVVSYIHNL